MGDLVLVSAPERRKREPVHREQRIAALARRQHGVVTKAQLRELGLADRTIERRVSAGRLHRLHRGVFAVGHPLLAVEGHWMAAVLACGRGALLSHRSAAALWGLRPDNRGRIDVTSPTNAGRRRPGIDLHRARSLGRHDQSQQRGIPCTSVARTLLDLADALDRRQLERACNQAEVLQLLRVHELEAALARRGRRAALLGQVLEARTRDVTRSVLEERFLALCRAAGLPPPRCNVWIPQPASAAVEVDFLWPAQRLIVETDGRAFHATRQAFERDRRRDQRLMLAGYRVVRFTWAQLERDAGGVAETVRGLLSPR
jgi:predicted transcriptional regulator of viral defense system